MHVNDRLMVIFVVGMEIRRELHHSELSDWRRAIAEGDLHLAAAVAPRRIVGKYSGD